jgi:sugar lactone lactonase YvrE
MQTTDLEAVLACLRRLTPEHAGRVDLVRCEGTLFATEKLVDAASGTGPMERRTIAEDVGRGLGLLAKLPRDEAESALAELPQGVRGAYMAKLPLTQAQGFGLASAASGGHWVSAPVAGHMVALAVHLSVGTPIDEIHAVGRDLTEAARLAAGSSTRAAMTITVQSCPAATQTPGIECVHEARALLGEGPVWNPTTRTLDWVDVLGSRLWTHDPASGDNGTVSLDGLVTAVLPATDGTRLTLGAGGLSRLDAAKSAVVPLHDPERERPTHRLNDAKCDSQGRIWAGTMRLDADASDGRLFRFDGLHAAVEVDRGFLVSNGIGWSPDNRTMFFVDTGTGTIFAYDFDAPSGSLANRRVFVAIPPENGRPDGLTVDAEGCLWVALWDGWKVARYTPGGKLDREIIMPIPRPTSCCFAGEGMRTLYITSARIRLSRETLRAAPLSGGLFILELDIPGIPTNLARV